MAVYRSQPKIKGPQLPRGIGRIQGDQGPRIVGTNEGSSYVMGYNPATGVIPTLKFLLQENSYLLLQENGDHIMLQ